MMAQAHEERDEYGVTPSEYAAVRRYPMEIAWSPRDKTFLASFPDVPGLRTHGATREEAAAMGDEVIVVWYTASKDTGQPIPEPSGPVVTARKRRVGPPPAVTAETVRQIRKRLNVSQAVFADLFNVNVGTVQSWEQGWRTPDGASLRLLALAEQHPAIMLALLSQSGAEAAAAGTGR